MLLCLVIKTRNFNIDTIITKCLYQYQVDINRDQVCWDKMRMGLSYWFQCWYYFGGYLWWVYSIQIRTTRT
ncbi:hypothetical protein O3M35_005885 [Rhynocoris fuscipes]|uniref:Uncharacterized protein n=1 Tax=Rhynocoris fuscipes TaxID=488301 RepID=A0AAW1DJT7_9HEMI